MNLDVERRAVRPAGKIRGSESRLLTLFQLLKQMSEGSESDPGSRFAELLKRRDEIDAEIARVEGGGHPLFDDTALKDRF